MKVTHSGWVKGGEKTSGPPLALFSLCQSGLAGTCYPHPTEWAVIITGSAEDVVVLPRKQDWAFMVHVDIFVLNQRSKGRKCLEINGIHCCVGGAPQSLGLYQWQRKSHSRLSLYCGWYSVPLQGWWQPHWSSISFIWQLVILTQTVPEEHDYTPVSHLMGKRALCKQRDRPHFYSGLCGVFSIKDVIFHFSWNKTDMIATALSGSFIGSAATDTNLN